MRRPKLEDYHDWCPMCKGNGRVPRDYRRGGWAGENITVMDMCPVCKGDKVWDNRVEYHKQLELYVNWLEEELKNK